MTLHLHRVYNQHHNYSRSLHQLHCCIDAYKQYFQNSYQELKDKFNILLSKFQKLVNNKPIYLPQVVPSPAKVDPGKQAQLKLPSVFSQISEHPPLSIVHSSMSLKNF